MTEENDMDTRTDYDVVRLAELRIMGYSPCQLDDVDDAVLMGKRTDEGWTFERPDGTTFTLDKLDSVVESVDFRFPSEILADAELEPVDPDEPVELATPAGLLVERPETAADAEEPTT